jgi:hypothetical protein
LFVVPCIESESVALWPRSTTLCTGEQALPLSLFQIIFLSLYFTDFIGLVLWVIHCNVYKAIIKKGSVHLMGMAICFLKPLVSHYNGMALREDGSICNMTALPLIQ